MRQFLTMRFENGKSCYIALLFVAATVPLSAFADRADCPRNVRASKNMPPEQKAAVEKAKQHWLKISRELRGEMDNTESDLSAHWTSVSIGVDRHFRDMLKGGHEREKVRYFVSQFGEHGPQADFRWLLVRPEATTNEGSGGGGLHSKQPKESLQARNLQLLMAEMQVRHFLKHKKKLERYYVLVLWRRLYFKPNDLVWVIDHTKKGLAANDKATYWWYARNVMLLLHATGRDDLLKGCKPDELTKPFDQWYVWFKRKGMYLRPTEGSFTYALDRKAEKENDFYTPFFKSHRKLPPLPALPTHPFPKWTGTKPPSTRVVNLLN